MDGLDRIRQMTGQDLANLGIHAVAYIKPVVVDGVEAFAVCSADGREMAVMSDRDVACAAVRQHDLEPVSVH